MNYWIAGVVALVYLVGAIGTARLVVWYVARAFPSLGWDSGDTAFTWFCAVFWPVAMPVMPPHVYSLCRPPKPSTSILARWHAEDRKKERNS